MKQDIHQVSDIQRYPIGLSYPVANPLDLRKWRYGRAGNTLSCQFGAHLGFAQDVGKPGASAAVTVDLLAAGKYTLEITVSDEDGRLGTGAIAKDELAGGYILIYPDGMNDAINRMVVANTATIAGGGKMTIKVLKPLPVALSPNPHAEIIANPYLDVWNGIKDRQMIVGMPTRPATVGQHLWLQTWGPCWAVPTGVDFVTAENSLAFFRANGSITQFSELDPATGQPQIAGTIMTGPQGGGAEQGAPFLFLQITP